MIYLNKFCFVCLEPGKNLKKLLMIQDNISYYDKLSILIPEMNINNNLKKIAFICNDCKKCTDKMFNFRTTCLRNNKRLQEYISQLCLNKNDIDNITSELFIVKHNREVSNEPTKRMIVNERNFLEFEGSLGTECNREFGVEECIKRDILDDEVIDRSQTKDMFNNYDINTNSESNAVTEINSISKITENMDLKDNNIVINKRIKCENNSIRPNKTNENTYVNDRISAVNVDKTISDFNGPTENEGLKTNEDSVVVNNDVSGLHTEIDINDCMKKETYDESSINKSINKSSIKTVSPENSMNVNKSIEFVCENTNRFSSSRDGNNQKNYGIYSGLHFSNETYNHPGHFLTKTTDKICNICNKSFSSLYRLNRHYVIHTGEKPYKCEICSKSFNDPSYLRTHIRYHTGERPYKCELCDKSFYRSIDLKIHKSIHTGVKPHKCEICNKTFNIVSALNRHKKVHSVLKPYKCDTCEKCFRRSNDLKRHIKFHIEVKHYECIICNKTFTLLNQLRKHFKVHTCK